jgi:hypothetical protein
VWDFRDIGGKVLITFDFNFEVPPTMTFRQEEMETVARDIEQAWGKSLDMLKWILESTPPSED